MEIVEHYRVTPGHLDDDPRQMDPHDKDQELSDCASETSEVLSVGSEPTPATDNLDMIKDCETNSIPHISSNSNNNNNNINNQSSMMSVDSMPNTSSRLDYQTEAITNSAVSFTTTSSRTPSPSPSSGSASNQPPSPHSSCSLQRASSPTPSIRSPASSHATQASSPIQADSIHEAIVSRYQMTTMNQQHLLNRYANREADLADFSNRVAALGGHETAFSAIESRLHHRIGSVPMVTRLSLSPPTAAVPGLTNSVFRPACRDLRETSLLLHPVPLHGNLLQHHATASMLHQHHQHKEQEHRLSISKLISSARDSKSPNSPSDEEPNIPAGNSLNGTNNSNHSNHSTNSNNSTSNSNSNSHHHHHRNNRNNGNNNDIQGNLKFSIDNILKADFGRRITDPISLKKSRPKKIAQKPIDLTKDFLESGTESSSDKVLTSDLGTNGSSSNISSNINSNSSNNNNNGNNNASSNNSASGNTQLSNASTTNASSLTSTPATGDSSKQMLWPAWVYCTRYSDRPSSGRSK
ncbi:bromodomain-containing protein DDB_G0270170 [Microplitis demolitor]|uniref:bromodomain-containing protein DDB_G0270170 n=1 Tax=Microplitis demolitor TaxID=69319 RepID=UPI00235B6B8D|nr:bromodomain-containing protein DDB_G0270170 [Microplitis demolitor]